MTVTGSRPRPLEAPAPASRFLEASRWCLWYHRPLVSLAVLSTAVLLLVDAVAVPHLARGLDPSPWTWLLVPILPVVLGLLTATIDRIRGNAPWSVVLRRIPLRSVASVVVVVAATRLLLASAMAWKRAIPSWRGFSWDTTLYHWDRAVIGGTPVVPGWLLVPLDAFYASFFVVFPGMVLWYAWHPYGRSRRFLSAAALAWVVLGVVAATMFASAGPCYYAQVTGDPAPYADLLWALGRQPLLATEIQQGLWRAYKEGLVWTGSGISAFPSMHVAIPTLYALAAVRWRVLWWGVLVITWFASVALGWHYAVDGLAGIVGALGCWWLAGRFWNNDDELGAAENFQKIDLR
jgi:PAP2 superfamily